MSQDRWFEDYVPGAVHDLGSVVVDEKEIIAFARQFDPQPFHLDKERAQKSAFGGLIASGWHTACMAMRLIVERYLSEVSSEGSPGIDELRWLRPVRPGLRRLPGAWSLHPALPARLRSRLCWAQVP